MGRRKIPAPSTADRYRKPYHYPLFKSSSAQRRARIET
nr:MAG TPA: hypothetical protein [Caudoviricetes sp.]DAW68971.1 MAG TPA: hypothetical protein [Caudoviricetes sp.]